jgi:hypothetical protein
MTLFKLVWYWYEDTSYWLFVHPRKTHSQWINDCNLACQEATKRILSKGDDYAKGWIGAPDIFAKAAVILKRYGYAQIRTVDFDLFGNYIIDDERIDEEEVDSMKKIVGTDLYDKIVEHNKKLKDKQRAEFEKDTNEKTTDN